MAVARQWQGGADAFVRARPPGRALELIVNSHMEQDTKKRQNETAIHRGGL